MRAIRQAAASCAVAGGKPLSNGIRSTPGGARRGRRSDFAVGAGNRISGVTLRFLPSHKPSREADRRLQLYHQGRTAVIPMSLDRMKWSGYGIETVSSLKLQLYQ